MGLLRLFGVPEGMTAADARKPQKLNGAGVALETVAPAVVKTEPTLADDDGDIEVVG